MKKRISKNGSENENPELEESDDVFLDILNFYVHILVFLIPQIVLTAYLLVRLRGIICGLSS